MSHLNYNHLYYFWMVKQKGSVTKAAEALCLTPQTVTGQIKTLEQRLNGALFKRVGRSLVATELGELVFRYADKMFNLSYEMLDILNYQSVGTMLFKVGIEDSLSKALASRILLSVFADDGSMKLGCFESTHEDLMGKLREHKLDMILSECAGESLKYSEILSKRLGQCGVGFFSSSKVSQAFPLCLEEYPLLMPSISTALGQQLYRWIDDNGLNVNIVGEFDDSSMMRAFAYYHQGIFVAPSVYKKELLNNKMKLLGEINEIFQEYHVIFAERMIQHPALKRLLETDFSELFAGLDPKIKKTGNQVCFKEN